MLPIGIQWTSNLVTLSPNYQICGGGRDQVGRIECESIYTSDENHLLKAVNQCTLKSSAFVLVQLNKT